MDSFSPNQLFEEFFPQIQRINQKLWVGTRKLRPITVRLSINQPRVEDQQQHELDQLVEGARLFSEQVVEGDAVLIALILHLLNNLRDTRIGFFS